MAIWLQLSCDSCGTKFRIGSDDMGDAEMAYCPDCGTGNDVPANWTKVRIVKDRDRGTEGEDPDDED